MAVVGIMAVQQLYAHQMTACLYLTPSPKTKCSTSGAATFEFCLKTKFRSSFALHLWWAWSESTHTCKWQYAAACC